MPAKSIIATSLLLVGLVGISTIVAQEAAEKPASDKSEFRGRLPAYWGEIVTEQQKLKIYDIQKGYVDQIDKLEAEIAKLEAAMDKECESLLTQPQRDRLKELVQEEEQRRKKNEAAKKAAQAATGS
ncbi:hypothetical protein GC197_07465 [bacterium]|nr:hypothetical protein [bacterium]